MSKFNLTILLLIVLIRSSAQIQWSEDSTSPSQAIWNNYSTSYMGDMDDKVPFLVTAIPYNGMYSNFSEANTPLDLSFPGSLYHFQSGLSEYYSRKLFTIDSSNVYFLAFNLDSSNAAGYEYRVVLDATKEIKPWGAVSEFSDFTVNKFNKNGCGFLGGFKTTWDHFLVVELRGKKNKILYSSAIVYWKQVKPVVEAVYTSGNLNDFFNLLRNDTARNKPTIRFDKLSFPSSEKTIIFCLTADVIKKEAIEYELIKGGQIYRAWDSNDFDNNFIWLKNLPPGSYELRIRYKAQRHNVSTYQFDISPLWHQTRAFQVVLGGLIAAFIAFIFLFVYSQSQKNRLRQAALKQEKLEINLQSLRSQLNPHFIFNALASIQALINSDQRDAADIYLSKFSGLLRQSLQYGTTKTIPLAADIELLDSYVKLEQLRFSFNFSIIVDKEIETNFIEIPPMLLQPLVENAVKHGISGLRDKGELIIRFRKAYDKIVASITDNGFGFNPENGPRGHGLNLTFQRIVYLNQADSDRKIDLKINSKTGQGTEVIVTFSNWVK